ncbi:hypothetical protein DITRI_Ditri14bG0110300 [Diplodiscus trichospermus]
MRNSNLSLFAFCLIALTFTLQPLQVISTEATIIDVCRKTPDATLCETCLRSDPKGVTADIMGLALISIACDAVGRALGDKGVDATKQAITRDTIPFISFCSDLFNKNPQVAVPKNILDETTIASKQRLSDYTRNFK